MTVITALISRSWTVHATDSLRTVTYPDGTTKGTEWKKTKIVPIRHFHGAMSYWGLDSYAEATKPTFSVLEWLGKRAGEAKRFQSPGEFADYVASSLNDEISSMAFLDQRDSGIGIHFTTHEFLDDLWIPELFLITNFASPEYREIREGGIAASRRTYHKITKEPPSSEHSATEYRMVVHEHLARGAMLVFYNGDWEMFYPAAQAVFDMYLKLQERGHLDRSDVEQTYRSIAKQPVQLVSSVHSLAKKDLRCVGGKVHDYSIQRPGIALRRTRPADDLERSDNGPITTQL